MHDVVFLDVHCFSDQYKKRKKKKSKQKFFVEDWLSDPDLKDWVQKNNNKANAQCSVCNI